MIQQLTTDYNRARQTQITSELPRSCVSGMEGPLDSEHRKTHQQVIGSDFDAEFSREQRAGHLQRPRGRPRRRRRPHPPDRRGAAAPRRRQGPLRGAGLAPTGLGRGMDVVDTGGPVTMPVGQGDPGPGLQPAGRAHRRARARRGRRAPPDPPRRRRSSTSSRPRARCSRPASRSSTCCAPFVRGGKTGLFGGAGAGQDRRHPGTHRPHRHQARRLLRLRRRRRANPRRQRPVAGNAGDRDRRHRRARSSTTPPWSSGR